jgi:23S rRNA pseudouridine1911/1915/1917 synthase
VTRHEFTISHADEGTRLDLYLAAMMAGQSRSQIQRLIREGHVRIGERQARANTAVRAGEVVIVEVPSPRPASPEAEPLPLEVVYEDRDLLVVDKPAGMVVHPGAGHAQGTLVNALLYHVEDLSGIGGEERPGIVHRLDRGTSGLLVVAKHDAAHRELSRQFHIGRDPVRRQKMSARARRARSAVTRVVSAEQIGGVSLVGVAIATGRTHQIRVHLSAIGHPVVGDHDYGGVRRQVPAPLRAVLRLERPFLHAAWLVLHHPADQRRMEFDSPLPEDLQEVLDDLRSAQSAVGGR